MTGILRGDGRKNIAAAASEGGADDAQGDRGEGILVESIFGDPGNVGDVAAGMGMAREDAAGIIENDEVILDAAIGVAEDTIEDFEEVFDEDIEARLFAELAAHALAEGFAGVEGAARDGPSSLEGRRAAPDEQNLRLGDDQAADANDGPCGIGPAVTLLNHEHPPARTVTDTVIYYRSCFILLEGGTAVVKCPECDAEIDLDEDELEEGEIVVCAECETELEIVQVHPL